ncbi:MAG: chromate transporter [Betaproteobacteria bacterium]|nr:MAG: chromate transporter [Betaproteobacteria bacterium]
MPSAQQPNDYPAGDERPKIGPIELFIAFSQLAMSGFGGVLPWAHRTLVERKGWLTQREFVDTLALGQLLPGPNIGNMAVMIGYRFAGYPGAIAAVGGLVCGPFLLMVAAGMLYTSYGALPLVQQALSGMSAVAAGLVLATGLKMTGGMKRQWRPWLFTALALAGVGALRWPLLAVVGALAPFAVAAAWRDES